MAPKAKYYVVWRGRKPGIYESWAECEAQVKGFANASYKAFPTRAIAEVALRKPTLTRQRQPGQTRLWEFSQHPPITASISVDAACAGNPGRLEWRGVHTISGKELFRMGPFPLGTSNIGEFLAIVQALTILKQRGNLAPVYSDSATAIAWVRAGKCKTGLPRTTRTAGLFRLIDGAEAWLAENEYENEVRKWNTKDWGQIPADYNRK